MTLGSFVSLNLYFPSESPLYECEGPGISPGRTKDFDTLNTQILRTRDFTRPKRVPCIVLRRT